MSTLNSIERSKYINDQYKTYLKSSFEFSNDELQGLFEQQLDKEELFKGPYVDMSLPFQRGKSLDELISENVICKSFKDLGDVNLERPLYAHQEESIRHICSGNSAIVTTGTGSGKTECFLYPILNEILKDLEDGNNDVGIRAIFLYPMNALVNDQIDRVRQILSGCPEITFGFFTGETLESVPKDYREKAELVDGSIIPPNELVSREEIRNDPPHLLFTNYSMLEYLLIRPNDYSIFSPKRLSNWKFVVLDEAHTYSGALGIEISLLMRRLTGLAPRTPRFILTSATLGEQGKSEADIVTFAQNLTSVNFNISDIIFAKRIPLAKEDPSYSIAGEDYIAIKQSKKSPSAINFIAQKYLNIDSIPDNRRECLFELLSRDQNVYTLYHALKDVSNPFNELMKIYNGVLSESQLISLIDDINQAEKQGVGLFDLKYHSFVRPLSGAFITLENKPELTLTKTNQINELRAFEVGNCKFCNAPYIIGKIIPNPKDGLEHLYQNNEVDIYENYGSNDFVNVDYFVLDNVVNENEADQDVLEEYKVCAKCGAIYRADNLNAEKCVCGNEYIRTIYKVPQNTKNGDPEAFNNINQCPCCGNRTKSGVVRMLDVGKDEGTALIAQILLEAMDSGESPQNEPRKLSLIPRQTSSTVRDRGDVKQFLSFSDSRQQASFFATFFNSNYQRMLRKRLIWKVIEDNKFQDLSVDQLVSMLGSLIKKHKLFDNNMSAEKNAWIATMVDLLKVDGSYDGEGLGLYYFDLNLEYFLAQFTDDDVADVFEKYNITKKDDLATMMQVVLGVFKTAPAIEYAKSGLTTEEKKEALEYRRFDNRISYKLAHSKNDVKSFLPIKGYGNMVVRYVQKVCECSEKDAEEFLNIIFNDLAVEWNLLDKYADKTEYQINVSKYIIKNYKTSNYYRCTKCGRLTPYNVHNKCVQDHCNGLLVKIDPDNVLASNYYRNQYKNRKIENIVINEHTAQLSKQKAKEYQRDFKDKKINILSCSTTFEMGIDIGNLETVFMRNVPPTPANYVQRAGRAGRRKDSSAYILTYCGSGSHDYTYFNEPEKMISGVINPPHFDVVNRKIIIRHLMATCLGSFFRQYPQYFQSINQFVFNNGSDKFKDFIFSHPADLNRYINNKILPENQYKEFHDFKWFEEINGNDEKLDQFVSSIKSAYKEFLAAEEEASSCRNYRDAEYYHSQAEKIQNGKMLDALSRYCVIPKYGFPIDLVELQIYEDGKPKSTEKGSELTRDLRIAISEYAPDSEILVDKKKYTSKYITLPKAGEFRRNYFCTCQHCKKINVYFSNVSENTCKYCGEPLGTNASEYYIDPVYGFKTGYTKESSRMKPKRSYAGEVTYLGGGHKDETITELGNAIAVETSSDDELLVMNKKAFYFCPKCGYSEIAKNSNPIPVRAKTHKNCRQIDCDHNEINRIRLGHSFKTDVTRLRIPLLASNGSEDYSRALSFMYALLEGISNALEIERIDIDGVLEMDPELGSFDIILYDNVPGGAGHVKRLLNKKAITDSLKAALVKVSQNCCEEDTSCYNCLRNYNNQMNHSRLRRGYAKEIIEELLNEI